MELVADACGKAGMLRRRSKHLHHRAKGRAETAPRQNRPVKTGPLTKRAFAYNLTKW